MSRLKNYRNENNFSCQEMANMLQISKSFYWQIENNKRKLSYETAIKIADIFKTTPDKIFLEDFYKKNKN